MLGDIQHLRASNKKLSRLKGDFEKAQKRHALLVNRLLDRVERNPSHWSYTIAGKGKKSIRGPVTRETVAMLRELQALAPKGPVGGWPIGCPDITGCALIADSPRCMYLCKTVKFED